MNKQNREIGNNFITELYYGNIDPQSREFRKDSYLKKQKSILADTEKALTERLTGDVKKAFLTYVNAWAVVLGESKLDAFIVGFRLSARFCYDTFVSDSVPYKDTLKEDYDE